MGMPTCYSVPVNAKVFVWYVGMPGQPQLPEWQRMIASYGKEDFEEWKCDQLYDAQANPNPNYVAPQQIDINNTGWIFEWKTKTFKDIYVNVISKDGKEVYALNTDQYSSVGEITVEVFAEDESDLLDFIIDLIPGRSMDVITNDTVHQWM